MARKSLKPKTRFDVFKRDGFVCQYCGKTPPEAILEVDHIVPVSEGGSNNFENLVTACFDCNRGKGATSLDSVPQSIVDKASIIKEKEEQLKAYNKILKDKKNRLSKEINTIAKIYSTAFPEWKLTDKFQSGSVGMFLDKLPFEEVEDAMQKACARISDSGKATKYFCGICWNKIKGDR